MNARTERVRFAVVVGVGLALSLIVLFAPVARLVRARRRGEAVPLSPLTGGRFVGADWVERVGVGTDERPVGEMDEFAALARPGFDPAAVDPEIRRFYERTSEYDLRYRVRWGRGFRLGAALATRLTSGLEQLNLPAPGERGSASASAPSDTDAGWRRLRSRFVGVDADADPREEARAWIRTDSDTGEAVFVAVYGVHEREQDDGARGEDGSEGERFVNIAVPLPATNLSTVLRVEYDAVEGNGGVVEGSRRDGGAEGGCGDGVVEEGCGNGGAEDGRGDGGNGDGGVRLTTHSDGDGDDPGLYLVTPVGAFALPMAQRFRVWPVGDDTDGSAARTAETDDPPALRATHEMWLLGRRFLVVEYEIRRRSTA